MALPFVIAALPSTTNYELQSFGFGSGGTAGSSTANYSLEGITGELSAQAGASSNFTTKPGFVQAEQTNVPKVSLSNPGNYYDKLRFVIDPQGNPGDSLYALQVCVGGDFPCGTPYYVKSDETLGTSLSLSDYQTYAAWGGSGGADIIGLTGGTTYYIRAKVTQGKFTESQYGPSSSAATASQQISFCIYTSSNCAGGGNSVAFGGLDSGSITTAASNIGVDFATNADNGGKVYIYSQTGGLKSASAGYTLASATADLSLTTSGYGAQVASTGQSTGGPFSKLPPYDGSGHSVGEIGTGISAILSSSGPLTGGSGSVQLQAKPGSLTPSANDYTDTLTLVAAASF